MFSSGVYVTPNSQKKVHEKSRNRFPWQRCRGIVPFVCWVPRGYLVLITNCHKGPLPTSDDHQAPTAHSVETVLKCWIGYSLV